MNSVPRSVLNQNFGDLGLVPEWTIISSKGQILVGMSMTHFYNVCLKTKSILVRQELAEKVKKFLKSGHNKFRRGLKMLGASEDGQSVVLKGMFNTCSRYYRYGARLRKHDIHASTKITTDLFNYNTKANIIIPLKEDYDDKVIW